MIGHAEVPPALGDQVAPEVPSYLLVLGRPRPELAGRSVRHGSGYQVAPVW
jgi:hypothetical protein